jgi:predicted secreted protein
MTMAIFAHGTTVTFDTSAVGGLTGISLPALSRDSLDTTTHGSAGVRSFLPGLFDGGTVELEGNYLPADGGQVKLEGNIKNEAAKSCVISVPTTPATTYTFNCFVTAFSADSPHDGLATFSCTLKVTGAVTKA